MDTIKIESDDERMRGIALDLAVWLFDECDDNIHREVREFLCGPPASGLSRESLELLRALTRVGVLVVANEWRTRIKEPDHAELHVDLLPAQENQP